MPNCESGSAGKWQFPFQLRIVRKSPIGHLLPEEYGGHALLLLSFHCYQENGAHGPRGGGGDCRTTRGAVHGGVGENDLHKSAFQIFLVKEHNDNNDNNNTSLENTEKDNTNSTMCARELLSAVDQIATQCASYSSHSSHSSRLVLSAH